MKIRDFFRRKQRRLKTVWRLTKERRTGVLAGTAHFCPYAFAEALTRLIERAEIVLFEGPLDEKSMAKVVEYGRQGENTPSLYEALDPAAIKEINKQLNAQVNLNTTAGSYLNLIHRANPDFLKAHTQGVRPWLAFFIVWSALLDWKHSMDMEAFHIAQKLGKEIRYLETIQDQLVALDGIPFERIVTYLNHIGQWKAYKEMFTKAFLVGDLRKFRSMTGEFPTRCESIIEKRDPIFFEGIKACLEEGKAVAFIGAAHIPGIRERFLDEGYQVIQES